MQHLLEGRWILLIAIASRAAAAQQFQERAGVLPLPADYWTEGTTVVDADEDGRWDCLLVHANGWAEPGDFAATGDFGLPLILLVNAGASGGDPTFVDRSAVYLPALAIHGKGAAAADVDGDGHDDLVVATAFQARQRVLIKDPATLVWTDQSAARLPDVFANSYGVGVGDLENDGDLDLVFADAGPQTFGAPGGLPRLCINDGGGFFAERPDRIAGSPKVGAQNAKIIDIDNDFDLDVIVDGKSPATQVYLNDGRARFTLDDALIPAADVFTYEVEWADLDNDSDVDGTIMSLDFFSEGAIKNELSETGALAFRASTLAMVGLPAGEFEDDNEFVMLDADDDGDLDVITASLQSREEKLYLNTGLFGSGFLQFQPGVGFSGIKDSTLGMCLADFDGDGDYDAITGQGESGDFTDRYYRNTGPPDTLPPRIGRVERTPATIPLAAFAPGGVARRCWLQDATWDDGWTFATARLLVTAEKLGERTQTTVAMRHVGGQIFRGVIAPAPASTGLVGMRVSYAVEASDPYDNTSTSGAQSFVICGTEPYGAPGPVHSIRLAGNTPVLGGTLTAEATGGPPSASGLLVVGTARAHAPLFGGELLVDLAGATWLPLAFDASGRATLALAVPHDPSAAGLVLDLQCGVPDPSKPQGVALSTGLEAALCAP